MLNSAAYYRLGIQFQLMFFNLLWKVSSKWFSTPFRRSNFPIWCHNTASSSTQLTCWWKSQWKRRRSLFNRIPPKQTLISSSSFMCHTFSSSFERIFQFYAHHQRSNTRKRNFNPIWSFGYVTNFPWHFVIIVVCLFPFPSSTATTTRRLRVFNFKYQKWALNYPQGVVEACCRFHVAKREENAKPFIAFYSRSVGGVFDDISRFMSMFFLPNYLIVEGRSSTLSAYEVLARVTMQRGR